VLFCSISLIFLWILWKKKLLNSLLKNQISGQISGSRFPAGYPYPPIHNPDFRVSGTTIVGIHCILLLWFYILYFHQVLNKIFRILIYTIIKSCLFFGAKLNQKPKNISLDTYWSFENLSKSIQSKCKFHVFLFIHRCKLDYKGYKIMYAYVGILEDLFL